MQVLIRNRELTISLVRKDLAVKRRLSIFDGFYRYFFGEDVFISYSRSDGDKYAKTLKTQLENTEPKHTCYIDELGTEPGKEIPDWLKRKIRTCSIFVLLGSPLSHGSKAIFDEIAEFMSIARNRTRLIPIDFDGHTRKALSDENIKRNIGWFDNVCGVDEEFEEIESLESGKVSDSVINRIVGVTGYVKQTDRVSSAINRAFKVFCFLVLLSLGLFGFALWKAGELNATTAQLSEKNQELSNTNTQLTETNEKLSNTNTQLANKTQKLSEIEPKLEKAQSDLVEAEIETKEAKQQTFVARKETAIALKDKDIALREKDKAIDEKIIAQNEADNAKKEVIIQKDIGSSYLLASEAVETFNNKDFSTPQALIKLFDATEMSLKWNNYDALFDSPLRKISRLYSHHKTEELKAADTASVEYNVNLDKEVLKFLDVKNNITYEKYVSMGDYRNIKAQGISSKGKYIWVVLQYEIGGVSETNNLFIFNTSTKEIFDIYDPIVFEFETNIFAVAFDKNEEKVIIVSNSSNEPKKTKLEYRILENEEKKINYTHPKDTLIPIPKDCNLCLASYDEEIFAIENGPNIVIWNLEYENVLVSASVRK